MTMRAIGRAMSHSSSARTGHTISRNPSGSFSGLRSLMAEYGIRSLGCILSLGNAAPRCTENIPQMAISYQILIRKFTPFVFRKSLSGVHLIEQLLGLFQIARFESFCKPAVDRREQI